MSPEANLRAPLDAAVELSLHFSAIGSAWLRSLWGDNEIHRVYRVALTAPIPRGRISAWIIQR